MALKNDGEMGGREERRKGGKEGGREGGKLHTSYGGLCRHH